MSKLTISLTYLLLIGPVVASDDHYEAPTFSLNYKYNKQEEVRPKKALWKKAHQKVKESLVGEDAERGPSSERMKSRKLKALPLKRQSPTDSTFRKSF